jgi:DNA-binding Lrp family transcriptional regulator
MHSQLDATDLAILKQLQDDGRITNVKLAEQVNLSAPPCLRRVRALEEMGIIKGYRAILDPQVLGYDITCFVLLQLESQARGELAAFRRSIKDWVLVRECWELSGDIDFILKCVATDLKAFQAFVQDITALPNIRQIRTSVTLGVVKDEPIVPIILPEPKKAPLSRTAKGMGSVGRKKISQDVKKVSGRKLEKTAP